MTLSRGGVCGAGSKTYDLMPQLRGRTLVRLTRQAALFERSESVMTLGDFAERFPTGWLLGGPTVAVEAIRLGLVDRTFLIRSPTILGSGLPDDLTPLMDSMGWEMEPDGRMRDVQREGGIIVERWDSGGST